MVARRRARSPAACLNGKAYGGGHARPNLCQHHRVVQTTLALGDIHKLRKERVIVYHEDRSRSTQLCSPCRCDASLHHNGDTRCVNVYHESQHSKQVFPQFEEVQQGKQPGKPRTAWVPIAQCGGDEELDKAARPCAQDQFGLHKSLTLNGHGSGPALKGHGQRTATGAFRRGDSAICLQAVWEQGG